MSDGPMWPEVAPAWRIFFQAEPPRVPGVCDAVFASPYTMPLQRKRELAAMLKSAEELLPRVVMEIGADKGGGFYHWCKLPTVRKAIAIEIRGTPYADSFRAAFPDIEFFFVAAGSRDPETVLRVDEFLGIDKIDCAFLDGEKCFFGEDFETYRPIVRSGGRVFLHDVNGDAPPTDVFKRLAEQFPIRLILDTSEAAEASLRATQGIPAESCYEGWLRLWPGHCGVGAVQL